MSRNYSSSRTSGGPVGRSINNDPGVGEERSSSNRDSVDPIDSLTIRSRKRSREDFSFKNCFASCKYYQEPILVLYMYINVHSSIY